jgi:DNA replicative helicase MCM subunit Mcm2 (Cdc46/Mcm family)
MHFGDVEVRGMICGLGELEKMITKMFFECGNCGAMNELQTYSRPRFPYEVDYTNSTKVTRCINCNKKFGNKYDVWVKNAVNIELQDLNNFNDLERLSVVLFDDDTKNISIGEQVVISGSIEKIRKRDKILPFLFADPTELEKTETISKNNIRNHNTNDSNRSDRSDRSDRSVGCNTSIEDSSSIKTVNSRRRFRCFYCNECHSSDQERAIHIDHVHRGKLYYPTPDDFDKRLRPNK